MAFDDISALVFVSEEHNPRMRLHGRGIRSANLLAFDKKSITFASVILS